MIEVDANIHIACLDCDCYFRAFETLMGLDNLHNFALDGCIGLPLPGHLDGESFVSELKNPDNHFKDYAYSRYHWGESIISDRYIYTEWTRKSGHLYGRMLYDHASDPKENVNVSEDPEYKKIVKLMKSQLNEVRDSIK